MKSGEALTQASTGQVKTSVFQSTSVIGDSKAVNQFANLTNEAPKTNFQQNSTIKSAVKVNKSTPLVAGQQQMNATS